LRLEPVDVSILQFAEQSLAQQCMQSQGFEYWTVPLATLQHANSTAQLAAQQSFPYDAASEGEGYMVIAPDPYVDQNSQYVAAMSPSESARYSTALFGPDDDQVEVAVMGGSVAVGRTGCLAAARIALYGDLGQYAAGSFLTSNLELAAHSATSADEQVLAAMSEWSSCMSAAGWTVSSFGEARHRASQADNDVASRIAQSDSTCAAATNLIAIYRQVYDRELQQLVDDNAGTIEAFELARADALAKAKQAVS
jgi:hypothetical protein